MDEKNKKLTTRLGVGVMLLGCILFFFIFLFIVVNREEKEEINYEEKDINSRYITISEPVLEENEGVKEELIDNNLNIEKEGVLEVKENRKVVKVDKELTELEKTDLEDKYDISFVDNGENGVYVMNISSETIIDDLEKDLGTQIETDIPVKMFADTIDWGVSRIGADKVWTQGSGSGIVIAIIDTGVQKDHPDLVNNIIAGYDFVNADNDPNDDNGHGTHVAGIASASYNQAGIVGVGNSAKILPIKVLNSQGYGYLSDVAKGIYYAADNGARVINLSLGSSSDSLVLKDAVGYATKKGVLVVAAAGNDGGAPCSYPAAYSEAVCVMAVDKNNLLASFSNIGGEISAPGVYNYSTYIGSSYRYLSGTSMATPHVAGSAALLMSVCTTCSTSDIRKLINETAVDLGEVGKDILFGYGLVDLTSAVAKLQLPVPEIPIVEQPEEPIPTDEKPTPSVEPKKEENRVKKITPQSVSILEPVVSKGSKYIPTEQKDIEVKYTLVPTAEESNLVKVVVYVDNKEVTSSELESGTFILSNDLFNHSQHWIKVEALFLDNSKSSQNLVVDMTYLKSLERTKTSGRSVLGISISIFDWLRIF